MEDTLESAKKILSTLIETNRPFITLRELAKASGFERVHNKQFKDGFRLLQRKNIVKLNRSGWKSEGYHKPAFGGSTTVLLTTDVYTLDEEKNLEEKETVNVLTTFSGYPKVDVEIYLSEEIMETTKNFFSSIVRNDLKTAKLDLKKVSEKIPKELYYHGFYTALSGMLIGKLTNDSKMFINKLDLENKESLGKDKKDFGYRMVSKLNSAFDRGFFKTWFLFMGFTRNMS